MCILLAHSGVNDIKAELNLNGYMMAFRIQAMQKFAHDPPHVLFDPSTVNTGNELALCRRIGTMESGEVARKLLGVHTTAFVFHYKGQTVNRNARNRDVLGEVAFKVTAAVSRGQIPILPRVRC